MTRRIVSLIRRAPGAARGSEPSLEANAYAVTQELELTVVLLDEAVRLATAGAETRPRTIAGAAFPPAAPAHDLRALLESGIRVLAHADGLAAEGLDAEVLLPGVSVVTDGAVADLIADADGVLTW